MSVIKLNLPLGTALSRLSRAQLKLKNILSSLNGDKYEKGLAIKKNLKKTNKWFPEGLEGGREHISERIL